MQSGKLFRGILAGVEAMKAYRLRNSDVLSPSSSAPASAAASSTVVPEAVAEPVLMPVPEPRTGKARAALVLPPTVIRTSEKDWLPRLTRAYREHAEVELVDDATLGVDPATQSLLQMGLAGRLTRKEWTAVAVSGGMTVFGAGMVVLAVLDPEPTSKLGLLVGGGALLALTGGFQTVSLLTRQKPPSITISAKGIHIDWDS